MVLLLLIPLATAVACYLARGTRAVGYVSLAGAVALAAACLPAVSGALSSTAFLFGGLLFMDALSAYMLVVVVFISLFVAIYSVDYMGRELDAGLITLKGLRQYYVLLHLFVFSMVLANLANNLAVFWIAIEATTLVSALLVGFYRNKQSIEAAWKYIIICTVSITFALLGIFIAYYASVSVIGGTGTMNWTELRDMAGSLNPATVKLAFVLILVGYGAKAGLAPVHNWLPDAHSQAPTPISALLSGVLLKCAFIGVVRFVVIVNGSAGPEYSGRILLVFGLLSMGIATAFILLQNNYKRLLAYSSIEHIGIISIGFGIGGFWGVYGALLHVLNHAIVKVLLFFTTGRVRLKYGTTKIDKVKGAMSALPLSGTVMLVAALAIAGAPPFNVFLSEFTILKAAVDTGSWTTFALFMLFATVIFGGVLHHVGGMAFGKPDTEPGGGKEDRLSGLVIVVMASLMLVLGLYVPSSLDGALRACVRALGVI